MHNGSLIARLPAMVVEDNEALLAGQELRFVHWGKIKIKNDIGRFLLAGDGAGLRVHYCY